MEKSTQQKNFYHLFLTVSDQKKVRNCQIEGVDIKSKIKASFELGLITFTQFEDLTNVLHPIYDNKPKKSTG